MDIIQKTEAFVKQKLGNDASGHDWYHIDRVRKTAIYINSKESNGNKLIIELASLLHDIADIKLNSSIEKGKKDLMNFLHTLPISVEEKTHILVVIESVSYNGGHGISPSSIEAKIVQDADRLDAIGAIGIARTFAYGGKKGSLIYDPAIPIKEQLTEEEYRQSNSTSIHHFYEKLLKLRDLLHTETAKQIGRKRHQLLEDFLAEFYKEWNGQYEEYFN